MTYLRMNKGSSYLELPQKKKRLNPAKKKRLLKISIAVEKNLGAKIGAGQVRKLRELLQQSHDALDVNLSEQN